MISQAVKGVGANIECHIVVYLFTCRLLFAVNNRLLLLCFYVQTVRLPTVLCHRRRGSVQLDTGSQTSVWCWGLVRDQWGVWVLVFPDLWLTYSGLDMKYLFYLPSLARCSQKYLHEEILNCSWSNITNQETVSVEAIMHLHSVYRPFYDRLIWFNSLLPSSSSLSSSLPAPPLPTAFPLSAF